MGWAVPVILLVPVVSMAPPLWSRWSLACREAAYVWPLGSASTYTERHDTHGSGAFGSRRNGARTHNGIDLVAPVGTPVKAAKSGLARRFHQPRGMGRYLEIEHPDRTVTLYGHLSEWLIADGQWVAQGQPIGLVGKSGNARSSQMQSHLHFELRLQGVPLDPLDGYLEGTEVSA